MTAQNDPFVFWEKEQTVTDERLVAVRRSLNLAQELNYHMVSQPIDFRKEMGMEALRLLAEDYDDFRHHEFAVHVQHAYLHIKEPSTGSYQHTRQYGEMRLTGQIGYFTLEKYGDLEYAIALQMFEPKQLFVRNKQDKITSRLPEPLSLPVAGIINDPILIK